jgi:hypothetical protein
MLIEEMKEKAIEFTMLDSDDEEPEENCKHDHNIGDIRLNHEGGSESYLSSVEKSAKS